MSSNDTSTANLCDMPGSFWLVRDCLNTFTYYVVVPIFFFIGLFGHSISFIAYYKESRTTSPYMYQALVMGAESAKIIILTLYMMSIRWFSRLTSRGAFWYMSNYVLMWWTAHLAIPVTNTIGSVTVLLTVAMASDRLRALVRPHLYSSIDQKKFQLIAVIAALIVGTITNVFDLFRYYLIFDGNVYKMILDTEYVGKVLTILLVHTRNSVQGLGAAALIVLNVVAIRAFQRLSKNQVGIMNDKRVVERKRSEKTLLFLSCTTGFFMIVDKTVWIVYNVIVFSYPPFLRCGALIYAPLMEANSMICTVASFYVCAFISKPFRALMAKHLRRNGTNVTYISPTSKPSEVCSKNNLQNISQINQNFIK